MQKRAPRFVLDDYTSSYKLLLEKSGKLNMNLARERLLCIEVYHFEQFESMFSART